MVPVLYHCAAVLAVLCGRIGGVLCSSHEIILLLAPGLALFAVVRCLVKLRLGDDLMGLVGEIQRGKCLDIDQVDNEGDDDVVGFEHEQVHDV